MTANLCRSVFFHLHRKFLQWRHVESKYFFFRYLKSSIKSRGSYSKLDVFNAVLIWQRRLFKQKSKVSDEWLFLWKRIDISSSSFLSPSLSKSNGWSGSYTFSISESIAWNGSISGLLRINNLCLMNVLIKRYITAKMRRLIECGDY